MTDLQSVSLEIYKKFKSICEKLDLSFWGIGGTCIGAVRHHGYIPWDDDIDVAMPYSDYIRFIKYAQEELEDGFDIFYGYDYYIKMCDSNTAFINAEYIKNFKMYKGVGIDVFPVFGMERGENRQLLQAKNNDFYVGMYYEQRYKYYHQKSLKRKIAWNLLEPLKLYKGYKYWVNRSFREFSGISFDCSDKVLFAWRRLPSATNHYQSVFNYKDFETYTEMPFEDTVMRVPIRYDSYLKDDFGDYMQLPPEGERVSIHTAAVIDLHNSYKTYIGKL